MREACLIDRPVLLLDVSVETMLYEDCSMVFADLPGLIGRITIDHYYFVDHILQRFQTAPYIPLLIEGYYDSG